MIQRAMWTCEKCDTTIYAMQRGNHARFRCPKQGNMLKAIERQRLEAERRAAIAATPELRFHSFLQCMCGCGSQVGQVKGKRKKHYVDDLHYARHRNLQRRFMSIRRGEATEANVPAHDPMNEIVEERRLAEEIAPIVAKEEAARMTAESTVIVTGEASFRLWARCLGLNLVDTASVVA